MSEDARAILGRLIDRYERKPDRMKRIIERAPLRFAEAADREAFECLVTDAHRVGAVDVEFGHGEIAHLVEKVVLKDPDRLYAFLSRLPRPLRVAAAVEQLRRLCTPSTAGARDALERITAGWLAGRDRPLGMAWEDVPEAGRFVAALDAALKKDPSDRSDLRTYSRRTLGDSKAIERQTNRICSFMRLTGRVDPQLSDDDILILLGLEKYPQPVLIAGPLRAGSVELSALLYVGVPPDAVDLLEPADEIRTILTIENLASFNRHIREARDPGDVVIYTGGFPSRAVVAALLALCRGGIPEVWHWGDIDAGGVRIAEYLYRVLPVPLRLHMMTPSLAKQFGTRLDTPLTLKVAEHSPAAALASFLASPHCAVLEQEEIDPRPPEPVDRGDPEAV